mmetsp:Transcript_39014/g.103089  ORF Transcript_39014/g.103089 Transcript_39014/m.103089 type:complete len:204 (-) Transcript_39014:117-728(-)
MGYDGPHPRALQPGGLAVPSAGGSRGPAYRHGARGRRGGGVRSPVPGGLLLRGAPCGRPDGPGPRAPAPRGDGIPRRPRLGGDPARAGWSRHVLYARRSPLPSRAAGRLPVHPRDRGPAAAGPSRGAFLPAGATSAGTSPSTSYVAPFGGRSSGRTCSPAGTGWSPLRKRPPPSGRPLTSWARCSGTSAWSSGHPTTTTRRAR